MSITRPRGYKTWVQSQIRNKVQWLAVCGHVSASSQSLRFIMSLRLNLRARKYHNHRPTQIPWGRDAEHQPPHCKNTSKATSSLERTLSTTKQNKDKHKMPTNNGINNNQQQNHCLRMYSSRSQTMALESCSYDKL